MADTDPPRDDATTDATEPPVEERRPSPSRTPITQQLGRIVMIVAAVLFGVFAAANWQPVDFSWVVGETEVVKQGGETVGGGVPLIVLLAAAFVLGAVVGRLSTVRRTRKLKRRVQDH